MTDSDKPSCAADVKTTLYGLSTSACLPSQPERPECKDPEEVADNRSACGRRFDWLFNWCAIDPTPDRHRWRVAWWGWRMYLAVLHPPGPTTIRVKVGSQWVQQCVCCWISRAALLGLITGVVAASALYAMLSAISG